MVIAKNMDKMPTKTERPAADADKDPKFFQLDALKTIRESAFGRWDRRRGYEWQLSISIWTALAAFSGIVLSKDFPIENSTHAAYIVGVAGLAIVAVHASYLWMMISGTLGDAELQHWAEKRIFFLAYHKNLLDEKEYPPHHPFYPKLSRYGVLQAGITLILVVAAVMAVLAPRHEPAPPTPIQITVQK